MNDLVREINHTWWSVGDDFRSRLIVVPSVTRRSGMQRWHYKTTAHHRHFVMDTTITDCHRRHLLHGAARPAAESEHRSRSEENCPSRRWHGNCGQSEPQKRLFGNFFWFKLNVLSTGMAPRRVNYVLFPLATLPLDVEQLPGLVDIEQ